jgi:hypothetical protein
MSKPGTDPDGDCACAPGPSGSCDGAGSCACGKPATWAHRLGGALVDKGRAVSATQGGTILIAGSYQGSPTQSFALGGCDPLPSSYTNGPASTDDVFVAELDATQACKVLKRYGGAGPDAVAAVDYDAQGSLLIAGYFSGTIGLDAVSRTSNGDAFDGFVAKLDAATKVASWAHRFGGSAADFGARAIAADAQNNIVVAGGVTGSITSTIPDAPSPAPTGESDVIVCKPSTSGVWLLGGVTGTHGGGRPRACRSRRRRTRSVAVGVLRMLEQR